MGLPMIAVSPRQPPQPYLRHGCGPNLHLGDNPIGIHTPVRSHRGATLRLNGVFTMYCVENKQGRVAACCDLPGDGFIHGFIHCSYVCLLSIYFVLLQSEM